VANWPYHPMSTQIYEKFKKEEDEDEYIEYNSVTGK
jgi:hypothetical protein